MRERFMFKQKAAYEMLRSLVGSAMCISDSRTAEVRAEVCSVPRKDWPKCTRSRRGTGLSGRRPAEELV